MWASLTQIEQRIILFLVGGLLVGCGYRLVTGDQPEAVFPSTRDRAVQVATPAAPQTATLPTGALDINAASEAAFQALPGVGPAKAKAIVATRARTGGFRRVEDLDLVPGIGPATIERLRPLLGVGATTATANGPPGMPVASQPTPPRVATQQTAPTLAPAQPKAAKPTGMVNINTAAEAELATLDGIGPSKAQAIIVHRTRFGPFRSPEALGDVKGIGPKTVEKNRARITAF